MRCAVLCEFSGVVRDAFRARGHDAVSCDLLPSESPGPHIQGDCLAQDWSGFDLIVAHPPCTYLCNSGVRWLHTQPGRWDKMHEAADFFRSIQALPVARIAVENPIPHRHAKLGKPTQSVQPWMHGHGETKATCLWLKGLPPLKPSKVVEGRTPRVHHASPGPNRWKERSRTLPGIASAMATQWGSLVPPPPAENGQRRSSK